MALYDKLSSMAGPIDGILDRSAQKIANGENANDAKQQAYREIRAHVLAQADQLAGVPAGDAGGDPGHGGKRPHQGEPVRVPSAQEVAGEAALPSEVDAASARLKARFKRFTKDESGEQADPEDWSAQDWRDLVTVASHYLRRAGGRVEEWTRAMVEHFGEGVRPYLDRAYAAAREAVEARAIGPHGPIFHEYSGRPAEAIAKLQREQTGEVPRVWHHPELGWIDLVWGNKAGGLDHIIARHVEGRKDLKLADLAEMIPHMRVVDNDGRSATLESDTHKAAVRLDYDGQSKTWLVTGYEKPPTGGYPVVPGSPQTSGGGGHPPPGGSVPPTPERASGAPDTSIAPEEAQDNRASGGGPV
jgi:hypothetical protein